MEVPVRVSPNGGIVLGENVVCDGFVSDVPIRVQTHIHSDHMGGFESSKGYQSIVTSKHFYARVLGRAEVSNCLLLGSPHGNCCSSS